MNNNYYVYILTDPTDDIPFYVGKGTGKRFLNHEKEVEEQINWWSSLKNDSPEKLLSLKQRVIFDLKQKGLSYKFELIENLSESDSFVLEQALIAWFGRRLCGNGILTNVLSGGKSGDLFFDEQALIQIYNRNDLLKLITKYPRLSSNWIAKTVYFYEKNSNSIFKPMTIDWLYQYHQSTQQVAVEVIKRLRDFDSVISPFYWVKKILRKGQKGDSIYIMNEGIELIEGTYLKIRAEKEFNEYKICYENSLSKDNCI